MTMLPAGLFLQTLEPDDIETGRLAREFCLAIIKDTYGYDYTPLWHIDLDSLTWGPELNHYSCSNGGVFLVLKNANGEIVGTGALRCLTYKPELESSLGAYYPDFAKVGSVWRVYLHPSERGQDLGGFLHQKLLQAACEYGYEALYLHCESLAERLRAFWERQGYELQFSDANTAHYHQQIADLR